MNMPKGNLMNMPKRESNEFTKRESGGIDDDTIHNCSTPESYLARFIQIPSQIGDFA